MVKRTTVTLKRVLSIALLALITTSLSVRVSAQIQMDSVSAAQSARASSQGNTNGVVHESGGPSMIPPHFAELKLGPGFLLSLNVLDDPDFTGEYRVDNAGNINVPELGSIHVAGKLVTEAREEIAKNLLGRGILKDPQVELNVVEYTAPQVTVLGEVAKPGVFPLLAPEGLADVLALAGDTTMLAGDRIEITPPSGSSHLQVVHYSRGMDSKLLENVIIQPGDTVHVNRAGIVYVLGGVTRPGGYVMQESGNLSVLQAISMAGGTAVSASIRSIYIIRKDRDHTAVWLELPYKKMTQGKVADAQLHTNDVLYIPTSRIKSAFMNSQTILTSAASASIYAGFLY